MWRETLREPVPKEHRAMPVTYYAGIAFIAWAWTGAFVVAAAVHDGVAVFAAQWAALAAAWFVIAAIERRLRQPTAARRAL